MKSKIFFSFLFLLSIYSFNSAALAQSEPVLYVCVKYTDDGEVGISDRFTKGALTVMVKCNKVLGLNKVSIQYDKYSFVNGKFEFYKKFKFDVDPDMKYIFFQKSSDNDMSFDDAGFYRVFLLDERDRTVASTLVEIIR